MSKFRECISGIRLKSEMQTFEYQNRTTVEVLAVLSNLSREPLGLKVFKFVITYGFIVNVSLVKIIQNSNALV